MSKLVRPKLLVEGKHLHLFISEKISNCFQGSYLYVHLSYIIELLPKLLKFEYYRQYSKLIDRTINLSVLSIFLEIFSLILEEIIVYLEINAIDNLK